MYLNVYLNIVFIVFWGRRVGRSPLNSHPEITPVNVCSIDRFSDRAVGITFVDVSGVGQDEYETFRALDKTNTSRKQDVTRCEKTSGNATR